ncbi:MAG: hypothetical protein KGL39_23015 [Patescibacteria group bacterium]|nr:hypothetical protein [Patescibacteria group bacterium]
MERMVKAAAGSYRVELYPTDDEGAVVTTTSPFTLTVRDGTGATVATATPTLAMGVLSASIDAASLPNLDTYSLEWGAKVGGQTTSWVTVVELVGGFLFTAAALRNADRSYSDETKYPLALIKATRTAVEDVIEGPRAAARAFVPRGARESLNGSGKARLFLNQFDASELISVKINGTAWTPEQVATVAVDDNTLELTASSPISVWPIGTKNVEVHYVHGLSAPPPPIRRAALLLAVENMAPTDIPSRATAASIGDQMFRITVAGRDGITGIPDVDAAIAQFGRAKYRVG